MIEQIRDICSGCGILQPIQNKTHWLCAECVYKKNHGNKTKEQVYKERHEKKEDKKHNTPKPNKIDKPGLVATLKKTFSIKKISNKRQEVEKQLKIVYKRIDETREGICEGCGKYGKLLSHSHLLSRYSRPDLTCEEDNIRLHCFGDYGGPNKTCHEKWSDFNCLEVKEMLDFKENLEYIKSVDIKVYNKMIAKFEFEGIKI